MPEAARQKISEARKKRKEQFGFLNSPETRKKMSDAKKGKAPWNKGKGGYQVLARQGVAVPEAVKQKIRNTLLGRRLSPEHRNNISRALKGRPGHRKGIPLTESHRRKIAEGNRGRVFSSETRRKISVALTGKAPSSETRNKIAATLTGRKNPTHSAFMRGRHLSAEARRKVSDFQRGRTRSLETRQRMSAARKGVPRPDLRRHFNPNWIPDRSQLKTDRQHMYDYVYKLWMKQVKDRDGWKCRIANTDCSGRLEAHHILPWAEYPELRYDVNNGITLCHAHHPRGRANEMRLSTYFQELVAKTVQ